MNSYSNRMFVKTLFLQVALFLGIYVMYVVYSTRFLYLLLIPVTNIAYVLYVLSKRFKLQFGALSLGEDGKNECAATPAAPLATEKVTHSADEKTGSERMGGDERLFAFKRHILKKIIKPLVRTYERSRRNSENTSFQLDDSFIFDHKLPPSEGADKKAALCERLMENISDDEFKILKKIAECGWIFYQKNNAKHRVAVFSLLVNYFNFLMPTYGSIYRDPIGEFVKKGPYGISFDGPIANGNFYFYSKSFSKNDSGDPVTAFFYLLIYCRKHCSGMLGTLCVNDFRFLGQ